MPENPQAKVEMHKRQKIQDSNRAMFAWIAGMSVVVGLCGVVAWFVFKQAFFKLEVVALKNETVKTLKDNNVAAGQLRDNLRAFETNTALRSSRANEAQNSLSVIIDALPSSPNALALGASLQERLVKDIPGLNLESLSVDPTSSSLTESDSSSDESSSSGNTVSFRMVVTADDPNKLKDLLERFERSIRVIDIDTLGLERTEKLYTLTIRAHAYYEPAMIIQLEDKVKKP